MSGRIKTLTERNIKLTKKERDRIPTHFIILSGKLNPLFLFKTKLQLLFKKGLFSKTNLFRKGYIVEEDIARKRGATFVIS